MSSRGLLQNEEKRESVVASKGLESSSNTAETDKVLKGTKIEEDNEKEENHPDFHLDYTPSQGHPPQHHDGSHFLKRELVVAPKVLESSRNMVDTNMVLKGTKIEEDDGKEENHPDFHIN
ncbi:hypothetical protein M5689_004975 [Euphorbia peplus]|nr:hypothetical protein M5689_004975 [Euphorbia peplus]